MNRLDRVQVTNKIKWLQPENHKMRSRNIIKDLGSKQIIQRGQNHIETMHKDVIINSHHNFKMKETQKM